MAGEIVAAAGGDGTSRDRETSTISRVLMLLGSLADRPGATAQSLAAELDLPRSSVHRLLATLRRHGFADSRDGGFAPGPELFRIAGRLSPRMPYRRLAEPHLASLSAAFQETSILALLVRGRLRMYYAARGTPSDPMQYNVELGASEPLTWGATARVMLAHLTDREIAAAIARREPSPSRGEAPDEGEIRTHLATIREHGYGSTHSHRTPNAVGIAAPFFDAEGEVVGSIGFLIPEARWSTLSEEAVVAALGRAARAMSRQLGRDIP